MHDVARGKAAPNTTVKVTLHTENAISTPPDVDLTVPTASDGRYSADFTSARNLRGADSVHVLWTSAGGDEEDAFLRAPFMVVWIRNAFFEAQLNAFQTSTFALRTSGGVLRTQLSRVADEDGQVEQAYWQTSTGSYVATAIGDRVTASFASDASMVIPTFHFTADASTDVVSGTCLSNRRYRVEINGANGFDFRIGNAGPTGTFSEDFMTGSPYDVSLNDEVVVHCMFGTGDQVARAARAHG